MDPNEQQRVHFNRIADRYKESRSNINHLCFKELLWSEFLGDKRSLFNSKLTVLEPMCGYADGYDLLKRHLQSDIDYFGFDYSDEIVANVARSRPGISVAHHDITRFRPDTEVDLILILGGLHHVPHCAKQVVRSLSDALVPGGHFLSWEPTHGNRLFRNIREFVYARNEIFDAETERAFSVEELFDMFRSAGLELVDAMYPGLLSYVLYYNPDAFPSLNIGGPKMARALWKLECPLFRTRLGRILSFATLSLWRRPAWTPRLADCGNARHTEVFS